MDNAILYKTYLEKEDGTQYKKAYLCYPPGETMLCDCCDKERPAASITMLCWDVGIICIDCLEGIVKEFGVEDEIEKT